MKRDNIYLVISILWLVSGFCEGALYIMDGGIFRLSASIVEILLSIAYFHKWNVKV